MSNIDKVTEDYLKLVEPVLAVMYNDLHLGDYDNLWDERIQILHESKLLNMDQKTKDTIHNFMNIINYYNTTFHFKSICILDRKQLNDLFSGGIEETEEIMSMFLSDKKMKNLKLGLLEEHMKIYDNLEVKTGMVAILYKIIVVLTIYGYRIPASAYATFLYNQYKAMKMNETHEFA